MESLDSTLETKRPAAALNLLSQQKQPQAAISSEGQCQASISVFKLFPRKRGWVVKVLDLKSRGHGFKFCFDH